MRPRSIVAPLVLIAIGTLFLLRNLWPDIRIFDLFATYWPFLLIGWGLIRLVEVITWKMSDRPLPVSAVSGGEWLLAVLLCVFGSLFYWGSRPTSFINWPSTRITTRGLELFGERFDFPVNAEKQVGKTPRIVLDLGRGNAKIVGTDTDSIKITGKRTIQAYNQKEADDAEKLTPIEMVTMGDQIVIRTNQDKLGRDRSASADLDITVPRGASFEGKGRRGDFDIHDLNGAVEITSDNAGVRLQNIAGNVKIDLRRSDIVRAIGIKGSLDLKARGQDIELESIEGPVTVNGGFSGELTMKNLSKPVRFDGLQTELRIEKTPGSIRIVPGTITAENIQGPIRLTTKVMDVQLRDFTQSAEIKVDRGDLELRPSKAAFGKVDAETGFGMVDLVLPIGAKFALSASTRRGEVTNDYGSSLSTEQEGKGSSIKGNTGGPSITIVTHRGEVTVRKGSDAPAAIPPPPPAPKRSEPAVPPKVPAPVQQ